MSTKSKQGFFFDLDGTLTNNIQFMLAMYSNFMKELGIVFQINETSKENYKGFGMDFTKIHGNENYELPVPCVYVVNKDWEIVFVHFEEDYMTRLEPTDLLTYLKNINKKELVNH